MWNFPLFPEAASNFAADVDGLLAFLLGITIVFSVLIASLIVFLAARYRHSNKNVDRTGDDNAHLWLEIVWTVIPLILVIIIFGWGTHVFYKMRTIPTNALELYVVGKQWMWKIQHPEGHREINAMHIPVNQPIALTMISQDVIHSFYIPAFRVKMDVVPGRYSRQWFTATKTGEYHLFCAEYCGTLHASMIGKVVVMTPADYQKWLGGETVPEGSMSVAGGELFKRMGCAACHQPTGEGRGPNLMGLAGKPVALADGQVVTADDAYLRESILKPQAKLVRGYGPIMPAMQGLLSEQNVLELIAYIKTLNGVTEQKK